MLKIGNYIYILLFKFKINLKILIKNYFIKKKVDIIKIIKPKFN